MKDTLSFITPPSVAECVSTFLRRTPSRSGFRLRNNFLELPDNHVQKNFQTESELCARGAR